MNSSVATAPCCPSSRRIRALDDRPPLAIVWRCSCGEPGCASIGLRVRRERGSYTGHDAVIWDDWRIRFGRRRGLQAPGAIRFDARSYYSEFIRAQTSRSWDNAPRQTARELVAILDARPELLSQWGAVLLFARGYRHDGRGVIQVWLRHSSGRYELMLPCSATDDPVALAQHITERIMRTDPATWEAGRPIQGL